MLFRTTGLLILAALAQASMAQSIPSAVPGPGVADAPAAKDIKIHFSTAMSKKIWMASKLPTEDPERSVTTKASDVIVPDKDPQPTNQVFVLDLSTGNLASMPASKIKDGWNVGLRDYRFIYRVRTRVEHEGKPVASAYVTLQSGGRKQSAVIEPGDLGETVFFAVYPGDVKLNVEYKTKGKTKQLPTQTIDLKLDREQIEPKLTAVVDDAVETANLPRLRKMHFGVPPGAGQGAAAAPKSSTIGSWVVYTACLVVALGLIYLLLRYVQTNPQKVSTQLGKLGVQLPDADAPPDGDDGAKSAQPQPIQPVEQILLGDAPVAVVAAVPQSGKPKLISKVGDLNELGDGINTVGRDYGLWLSAPEESTLSRKHAELVVDEAGIRVRDLGSTNGTYVNGIQIQEETELKHGDVVQFGAVQFRFEQ